MIVLRLMVMHYVRLLLLVLLLVLQRCLWLLLRLIRRRNGDLRLLHLLAWHIGHLSVQMGWRRRRPLLMALRWMRHMTMGSCLRQRSMRLIQSLKMRRMDVVNHFGWRMVWFLWSMRWEVHCVCGWRVGERREKKLILKFCHILPASMRDAIESRWDKVKCFIHLAERAQMPYLIYSNCISHFAAWSLDDARRSLTRWSFCRI